MKTKRLSAPDRCRQIASVAARLFAKKGFNGVTTRGIAKKAKVNEAILFRHFPTKEALYTEIINQEMRIQPEMFNVEAVERNDDAGVFRAVARRLIKQAEEDNTFLRLMLFSALEDHRLSKIFFRERIRTLFGFLSGYIKKRIADGAFKNVEPRIIIRAFMGMFLHFVIARELLNMPGFLKVSKGEALENFVDIFLNGVKK